MSDWSDSDTENSDNGYPDVNTEKNGEASIPKIKKAKVKYDS